MFLRKRRVYSDLLAMRLLPLIKGTSNCHDSQALVGISEAAAPASRLKPQSLPVLMRRAMT